VDPVGPLGRARKGRQGTRFAVHLDVIVDGKLVTVPSGIGIDARARRTSPVAGPPGSVLLTPHLQIAVTYRPGPAGVPATYAFPAGT
jgi:hypothetical protein